MPKSTYFFISKTFQKRLYVSEILSKRHIYPIRQRFFESRFKLGFRALVSAQCKTCRRRIYMKINLRQYIIFRSLRGISTHCPKLCILLLLQQNPAVHNERERHCHRRDSVFVYVALDKPIRRLLRMSRHRAYISQEQIKRIPA